MNAFLGNSIRKGEELCGAQLHLACLIYLSHYIPGESIGLLAEALCLAFFSGEVLLLFRIFAPLGPHK